jgi:omega-amidase
LGLGIVCGISDRDGESIYNAQMFVAASGEIVAKYRKTHLVTAAPLDERSCFSPGNEFVSCNIDKFNVGLTICYDLRFPEMCRALAVEHNVNVFVTSSAWPSVRMEHLQILARARALENQSYLILANRVGTDDGVTFCGSSAIIDPSGAMVAGASVDREELLDGEISSDVIDSVRSRIAVFAHRRPELY